MKRKEPYYNEDSPEVDYLRNHPRLESYVKHFSRHDIDGFWQAWLGPYESRPEGKGYWFFWESKNNLGNLDSSLKIAIGIIDKACKNDPHYRGFHIIQFEHDGPLSGEIYLDGKLITLQEYVDFYAFESPDDWYITSLNTCQDPPNDEKLKKKRMIDQKTRELLGDLIKDDTPDFLDLL